MTRVILEDVQNILPADSTLACNQLDAAIAAATCLVDQVALSCGSDLTAECLKQVEIYLSAHFAAVTENTLSLKSEKDACGGSSATYGFAFGEGIKGTPFGQMANTLSGGCLVEFDKQPVGLFAVGSC